MRPPEQTQDWKAEDVLKSAYEAASEIFDAEELPSFSTNNHLHNITVLLNFYHEQYRQEKDGHQATDRYAQELRAERGILREEKQALKAKLQECEFSEKLQQMESKSSADVDGRRGRSSGLGTTQSQSLKTDQRMEGQLKSDESEEFTLNSQLSKLHRRLRGLEEEVVKLTSLTPLVELGSAIRLRCLERSRLKIEGCSKSKLDYVVIEKGNSAAHHGNGDADAALLYSGRLSARSQAKYSKIFAQMYRSDFSTWQSLPQKMKDALKCVATLNCLEAFDRLPNAAACRPIIDHVDVIRTKFDRLTIHQFDTDADVLRRLTFSENLTEQFVRAERQSKPGPGGHNQRSMLPSIIIPSISHDSEFLFIAGSVY